MSLVDNYNELRSNYGFENISLTTTEFEPSQFTTATKTGLTFSFPLLSDGCIIKLTQTSKLANDEFKTVINVTSTPPTDSPTEHSFFKDSCELTMILFEAIGIDEVRQFLEGAHLHFILNLLEFNYTFIPKLRYCGVVEISGQTNVFVLIDPVTMSLRNKLLETLPQNYTKQIQYIVTQITHEINDAKFTQPTLIRFNTFNASNLFMTESNQIMLVDFSRSIIQISLPDISSSTPILINPMKTIMLHEQILNRLEDIIHFGVAMIDVVSASYQKVIHALLNQIKLNPVETTKTEEFKLTTIKAAVDAFFKLFNNVSIMMQQISLFDDVSPDVLNSFKKSKNIETRFNDVVKQLMSVTEITNTLTYLRERTEPIERTETHETHETHETSRRLYYYKFLKYYTKYNQLK